MELIGIVGLTRMVNDTLGTVMTPAEVQALPIDLIDTIAALQPESED